MTFYHKVSICPDSTLIQVVTTCTIYGVELKQHASFRSTDSASDLLQVKQFMNYNEKELRKMGAL